MDGLDFENNNYGTIGNQQNNELRSSNFDKAFKNIELVTIDKTLLQKYKHNFNIPADVYNMFMHVKSSRHIKLVYSRFIGYVSEEIVLGMALQYVDLYHKLTELAKRDALLQDDKCYNDTLEIVKSENGDIVKDNVELRKELALIKEELEHLMESCADLTLKNEELVKLVNRLKELRSDVKLLTVKQVNTNRCIKSNNYTLSVTADTNHTVYFNTGSGISLVAKKLYNKTDTGNIYIHESFTIQNIKEDFGINDNSKLSSHQDYVSKEDIRLMVDNGLLDKSILERVENSLGDAKLSNNKGMYTITTETIVNTDDFGAINGLLDLPLQGITMSLNKPIYERAKHDTISTSKGVSFNAYVHDRRIKKLYTNIAGELVVINVNHNVDEEERIEVLMGDGDVLKVVKVIAVDDMEINSIYYSREKALLFKDNVDNIDIKERIALATHELTKKKQQAEESRLELELKYKELKEKLLIAKSEIEKEKLEKETVYNERSAKRNSWKDLVGIAASFVGLITSVMVLTSKYILPYV